MKEAIFLLVDTGKGEEGSQGSLAIPVRVEFKTRKSVISDIGYLILGQGQAP